MKNKSIRWLILIFLGLLSNWGVITANAQGATDDETGAVCVGTYGGNSCTANDVRIEELTPINIIEACNEGTIGELEVVFQALVSADGSPDRYDIATYLDLSGSPTGALDGTMCLHSSLTAPLTTTPTYGDANGDTIPDIVDGPWWDAEGNSCGDIESNTQVIVTLPAVRMPCVDNSGDPAGAADVHVCTSWRQNTSTCSGVSTAIPGAPSKCSCTTIEYGFTPTFIDMVGLEEMSQNNDAGFIISMLAVISLGLVTVVIVRNRKGVIND